MAKRIVRLTEADMNRLVRRVISEQGREPISSAQLMANKPKDWDDLPRYISGWDIHQVEEFSMFLNRLKFLVPGIEGETYGDILRKIKPIIREILMQGL
jgi:hypothetical protein